ncbi:phosphomannomutase [Planctomycetota bacterium]
MDVKIQGLMEASGVKFGTSGARGLATDMTDYVCYVYTLGFLQYLESKQELAQRGIRVAIAGDFRPSTDRIMRAVAQAVTDRGYTPVNSGKIPSPAVALYGLQNRVPAIMVTGSHIPADRNGIKFNKAGGEILKEDEAGIRSQCVTVDETRFTDNQNLANSAFSDWPVEHQARDAYVARYLQTFPHDCLNGQRIGIYQHSAVGRDMLVEIIQGLGGAATALGPSDTFIPVDTEAIRPEDVILAAEWAKNGAYHAILSTDGDSDRPLIADETGHWFRGDVAGILCAKYLGADSVSTPVSCNTAVDKCGWFKDVRRTRIGSPYVIASMIEATQAGARIAVGYEANGGFLTNSDIPVAGKTLPALPTRDALILHLSLLLLAAQENKTLSQLKSDLPARFTASGRLQNFSQEKSQVILAYFNSGNPLQDPIRANDVFGDLCGTCQHIDRTDGVRMTFQNDEIVHLRPSGNAPEFRCYNEASSAPRANELNVACIQILEGMK